MNGVFRTELECILTDAEAKTYSGELARLTQSQAELEDRKKEITSDFKSRIDACIAKTRVIARKVSSGKEMRDVEVRWDFDFAANCKYLVRLDTYQVIDTKPLNDKERQLCLDLEKQTNEEGPQLPEAKSSENSEESPVEPVAHQAAGLCVLKTEDTPCSDCGECANLPERQEPPFECLDCKKKKKARKCGDDCRKVEP